MRLGYITGLEAMMRKYEYEFEDEVQTPEYRRKSIEELTELALARLNTRGDAGWQLVVQNIYNSGDDILITRTWMRERRKGRVW